MLSRSFRDSDPDGVFLLMLLLEEVLCVSDAAFPLVPREGFNFNRFDDGRGPDEESGLTSAGGGSGSVDLFDPFAIVLAGRCRSVRSNFCCIACGK